MRIGNVRTIELIDWLDRLGFEATINKLEKESAYLKLYGVIVKSKEGDYQSSFGAETIEEVNSYLTGYIYATIDTTCRVVL